MPYTQPLSVPTYAMYTLTALHSLPNHPTQHLKNLNINERC